MNQRQVKRKSRRESQQTSWGLKERRKRRREGSEVEVGVGASNGKWPEQVIRGFGASTSVGVEFVEDCKLTVLLLLLPLHMNYRHKLLSLRQVYPGRYPLLF